MMMTTTATCSQPYTELGVVRAAYEPNKFLSLKNTERQIEAALDKAQVDLAAQAAKLGGNAVIGLGVTWINRHVLVTGTAIKLGAQ